LHETPFAPTLDESVEPFFWQFGTPIAVILAVQPEGWYFRDSPILLVQRCETLSAAGIFRPGFWIAATAAGKIYRTGLAG